MNQTLIARFASRQPLDLSAAGTTAVSELGDTRSGGRISPKAADAGAVG